MDLVTASGQLISARRGYTPDAADSTASLDVAWHDFIRAFEQVTQQRGTITQDQRGCARCGASEHPSLSYYPLAEPVQLPNSEEVWTHWALCPTTGEPIILTIYPTGESQ